MLFSHNVIRNRKCSVSLQFSDDQAVSATWFRLHLLRAFTPAALKEPSWGSSFTYQTWTCSLNLQHHQSPSPDSPSHRLVYSDFSFLQQQLRPFICHVRGYITCCLLARWQFTVEDSSLKDQASWNNKSFLGTEQASNPSASAFTAAHQHSYSGRRWGVRVIPRFLSRFALFCCYIH